MTKQKRLIIIFVALAVLTVLIIINSAVFSVGSVQSNSLNLFAVNESADRAMSDQLGEFIVEHHGLRMGGSMFMLNERRAIDAITRNIVEQSGIANFEIRALERIFPNRIVVHYILLRPYFYVVYRGQAKIFSNNGTLISIGTVVQAREQGAIELITRGDLLSVDLGYTFNTTQDSDAVRFNAAIRAFERIAHSEIRQDFRYVDISAEQELFVLRMAPLPGVGIEIRSTLNFTEHFRHGLSVYRHFLTSDEHRYRTQSGRLVVTETIAHGIVVTHTP